MNSSAPFARPLVVHPSEVTPNEKLLGRLRQIRKQLQKAARDVPPARTVGYDKPAVLNLVADCERNIAVIKQEITREG